MLLYIVKNRNKNLLLPLYLFVSDQVYTNSLSTFVPILTSPSRKVPFEESADSSAVLPFTNFNFGVTVLFPHQVFYILQPVSGLWSICKNYVRPRLIQSPPKKYYLLKISSTHSISEAEKLSSKWLLGFSIRKLKNCHSHSFIFIPYIIGCCRFENHMHDYIWSNLWLNNTVFSIPGGLMYLHQDIEYHRSHRDANSCVIKIRTKNIFSTILLLIDIYFFVALHLLK